MKKQLLSLFSVMLLMLCVFTGCKRNGDDPDPDVISSPIAETDDPQIRMSNPPNQNSSSGSKLVFNLELRAPLSLDTITIKRSSGGSGAPELLYIKTSGWKTDTKDNISVSYDVSETEGVIEFRFYLRDKAGNVATMNYPIYVNQAPLSREFSGKIGNALGGADAAWDLIHNFSLPISGDDKEKDMQNHTISTDPGPDVFKRGWQSKNSTKFVKARAGYVYEYSTHELAEKEYLQGIPYNAITDAQINDVYIAKIRGGGTFAVIKITNIVTTTNDNSDRIDFTYKKRY
jgi:hypothetical protein